MGASALLKEKAIEESWNAVSKQQPGNRVHRKSREVDFGVVHTLLERVPSDLSLLSGIGSKRNSHAHGQVENVRMHIQAKCYD